MNIETTDNSPLLQECIEELISSKIDEGKGRTAGNYRSAWNKLSTFLGPRVTEFYNPQIQISAESETKRSIFRKRDKTKRSKKESAQHSKSRNKSFVMTSVSAL